MADDICWQSTSPSEAFKSARRISQGRFSIIGLSRAKLEPLLKEHPSGIVAMEASATSHFWGRQAQAAEHEARLIPPIYVKAFVKRKKNDASDAAAIAEAARRPDTHYVAVKGAEHQGRAVAYRIHQCFVGQLTQTINAL